MNLIEADGIEAKAEVEKANGDAIENAKKRDGLHVNGFVLKEVET